MPSDALECAEFKYAIDFQIGLSIKKLWWKVHTDVYDFSHYILPSKIILLQLRTPVLPLKK